MAISAGGHSWPLRLSDFWRNSIQPVWRENQWLVFAVLWVAGLALGYVGWSKQAVTPCGDCTAWDIAYLTLQLLPLNSGAVPDPSWELVLARILIPAVAALTAFQAALFVFRRQVAMFRLQMTSNHAVICGLGRAGFLLAKNLRKRGVEVVAIEQNEDNPFVAECHSNGILVLTGDATDQDMLRRARVPVARYVVAVCSSDGANAEIAVRTRDLARKKRQHILTCAIRISDRQLYDLLSVHDIATDYNDPFRLELFNLYASGARALLKEYPPFVAADEPPACPPHILVVGLGHFGECVAVQAASAWQRWYKTTAHKLRVTIVDLDAERMKESLCLRYPWLNDVCQFIIRPLDVRWPEFRKAQFLLNDDGTCTVQTVYICLDDDALGLSAALSILPPAWAHNIHVIVRMTYDGGLASLLQKKGGAFDNLHGFTLLEHTCQPDLVLGGRTDILAKLIHDEYVSFKTAQQKGAVAGAAMAPWEQLPEVYRESNRRQADHIATKLHAVGCAIAPLAALEPALSPFSESESETMAVMEHERWMAERLHEGFRRGTTRDDAKKINPYLVPWPELPEDVKDWDRNTVRRLPAFLAGAGYQIYRIKERRT